MCTELKVSSFESALNTMSEHCAFLEKCCSLSEAGYPRVMQIRQIFAAFQIPHYFTPMD